MARGNGRHAAESEALRASQTQQDANPGPVAPAPTADAPVPLLARLRALAPWLLLAALVAAIIISMMIVWW
jgi:hypothetical protein